MMIDPAPEEIEVPHIISEGRGRHGAGTASLFGDGVGIAHDSPNSGLCHDLPMFLAGWCFKLKHH